VVGNGRRLVQCVRAFVEPELQAQQLEEQAHISLESGALCAISPIVDMPTNPDGWRMDCQRLEDVQRRGGEVIGQMSPRPFDFNFRLSRSYFPLLMMPNWALIMVTPVSERIARFSDRSLRKQLAADMETMMTAFQYVWVKNVVSDENRHYVGRFLTDIAKEEGKTLADAFLDIALRDNIETDFATDNSVYVNLDNVATMLNHPLLQIGASDGGAHVAQFSSTGDCPYVLEHFVRAHKRLALEHTIKRMTSEIADQTGIKDRGVIAKGRFADLILFNPDTIERGPEEQVFDLPGQKPRFIRHPKGIDTVINNGKIVLQHGKYTNARPGVII
jgi:N-acyl-D-aspartate/D-glutamate deacylase